MSYRPKKVTDAVFQMPLPQDPEAEKALLGAFLSNPDLLDDASSLPDAIFHNPANLNLYNEMRHMRAEGLPVEYVALAGRLADKGMIEAIGGQGALAELMDDVATPASYNYYKKILTEKHLLREICKMAAEMAQDVRGHVENASSFLGGKIESLMQLHQSLDGAEKHPSMKELVLSAFDRYSDAIQRQGRLAGIPTGFQRLDEATGGYRSKQLCVFAAGPKSGKTAFLVQSLLSVAESSIPVALYSLEVGSSEILDRLFAMTTQIDSERFLSGKFNPGETRQITEKVPNLTKLPFHIRDVAGMKLDAMLADMRMLCRVHGVKVIGVDYCQLIQVDGQMHSREREVAHISGSLKRFAKKNDVTILLLSQTNADGQARESRAIEQDADLVGFIRQVEKDGWNAKNDPYEDDRWDECKRTLVLKYQRAGRSGVKISSIFHGATFTFKELSKQESEADRPPF